MQYNITTKYIKPTALGHHDYSPKLVSMQEDWDGNEYVIQLLPRYINYWCIENVGVFSNSPMMSHWITEALALDKQG